MSADADFDGCADNFDDVGMFHAKFDLHRVDEYARMGSVVLPESGIGPQPVDTDLLEFRTRFLEEELTEFKEGCAQGDDAKMFDALLDLVYVAMGTAHILGYPWNAGWDLVQAANMAKQRAAADGSDSKRGSRWDVVKPAGWEPPDIDGLLREHGF